MVSEENLTRHRGSSIAKGDSVLLRCGQTLLASGSNERVESAPGTVSSHEMDERRGPSRICGACRNRETKYGLLSSKGLAVYTLAERVRGSIEGLEQSKDLVGAPGRCSEEVHRGSSVETPLGSSSPSSVRSPIEAISVVDEVTAGA